MLVSHGTLTRLCHERDEQERYLAEKRMLFFQMFHKIMQSSLILLSQILSSVY